MNAVEWLVPIGLVSLGVLAWALRQWIQATINSTVKAKFETELEGLKSDLRAKESRLNGLQNHLLSGAASRHALVEKRRIEAIERLWRETENLKSLRMSVMTLQVLKLDTIAQAKASDSRLQEFLSDFRGGDLKENLSKLAGDEERIFVSEEIWSTFSAYKTINIQAYVIVEALSKGIMDPLRILKTDDLVKLVAAVLPNQSSFLEKHGIEGTFFLVDEVHEKLLKQIRQAIEGTGTDTENAERTANIMSLVQAIERGT